MISSTFYMDDIKNAFRMFGVMNVRGVKEKLELRKIKLDEAQILDAIYLLIKLDKVRRSNVDGYFAFVRM